MCIFIASEELGECLHAECHIIRTIRKINKPIFKRSKQRYLQSQFKELQPLHQDSSIKDEKMELRLYSRNHNPRKTLLSIQLLSARKRLTGKEGSVRWSKK